MLEYKKKLNFNGFSLVKFHFTSILQVHHTFIYNNYVKIFLSTVFFLYTFLYNGIISDICHSFGNSFFFPNLLDISSNFLLSFVPICSNFVVSHASDQFLNQVLFLFSNSVQNICWSFH